MNFDPKSLNRLKELRCQIPKEIPKEIPKPLSNNISQPNTNKTLHPIETEQDPSQLFHELIKASDDGRVPPHLLNRLKELELRNELNKKKSISSKIKSLPEKNKAPLKDSNLKSDSQQDDLYTLFTQLLLEEEI